MSSPLADGSRVASGRQRFRMVPLHLLRVALFVVVVVLIHDQHEQGRRRLAEHAGSRVTLEQVVGLFPNAVALASESDTHGAQAVLDANGTVIGSVLQTSPKCDQLIGFSGPTNTLVAISSDDRLAGIAVLSSQDTRDHVLHVVSDQTFMQSFVGRSRDSVAQGSVDSVSGATLTSLAIQEAIAYRLGGPKASLRFPDPLSVDTIESLFPTAQSVTADESLASLWHVDGANGARLGTIVRSSPYADNTVGYQGPTESLVGLDPDGNVIGIALGRSYDNDPYVRYVREDDYFLSLFNKRTLQDLAELDLQQAGVEGVSGATMTSAAIAEGVVLTASQFQDERERHSASAAAQNRQRLIRWRFRDLGTCFVVVLGMVTGLTNLRGNPRIRLGFQCILIAYVGLINGDLISQAMLVGWAQNGIPWQHAGGLVFLTLAAFVVPLATRRNIYCTHLCPHGAAQQWLKGRISHRKTASTLGSKRHALRRYAARAPKLVPSLLLVWVIVIAMTDTQFSLVDIEPFDAWVFRIAGAATLTIAFLGLAASAVVPMAYCRFGCPTGALLGYLRLHSRSDRWSGRDWFAVCLVLLAWLLWYTA